MESGRPAGAAGCPFDYLVIVDLETACDDMSDPNRQEIVEWPWVVYDVAHGVNVDHKQLFVAPAWNANANPPPAAVRELGVDVAFAGSLREAVSQFDAYAFHSFAANGMSFCLLADGPWDIAHLLVLEAARKAVPLASHFRAFFDLRAEFRKRYPDAPPPRDRGAMVAHLGLALAPPASGIDACVAIASIVARLIYDGHVFAEPHIIPEADWANTPVHVPAVAPPVAAAVPVGGIVRLRGLPWACSEHDVARFLTPLPIVPAGIHFVRNSHGKATGEAFVQLETEEAVKAALGRHRLCIGRRYIEVFKSSPPDMSNHLGRADARRLMHQQHQAHAHVHKAAAAAAAAAAHHHHQQQRQHQALMYPTGSVPPYGTPPRSHNGGGTPGRNGRTARSPDGAALAAGSVTGLGYVVRVDGLPDGVAPDDLLPLFDGLEMVGDGIRLGPPASPSSSPDEPRRRVAFVQLTSESWAKKAVQRSGTSLAGGEVTIRRSSAGEMHGVLGAGLSTRSPSSFGSQSPTAASAAMRSPGAAQWSSNGGGHGFALQARGVGTDVSVDTITGLFAGLGVRKGDVSLAAGPRGMPAGGVARVAFASRAARDSALADQNLAHSGLRWEEAEEAEEAGNGSPTIVRMRGLPYAATDADIRMFFDGFQLAEPAISRGKDRHGRPSGEAWVTFADGEGAARAVAVLDKAHMGTRYIELLLTR